MNAKDKLIELRRKTGFTQQELAEILGVERSTYTGYELGKTHLPIDKIQMLSAIYNVPLDYFMEYEGSFFNDSLQKDFEQIRYLTDLTKEERLLLAQIRLLKASGKSEEVKKALKKLAEDL